MKNQEPASKENSRRVIGLTLIVIGLVSWLAMMITIVYRNETTGAKPTVQFCVATILCWGVFFIGKSILKFQNNKLEPKAPPTE
ncbi:MAG TPA: hypothetical protein PKD58_10495 [Candidatus Sumerlaeota bacterium]|nr:hypothetical protein [Candidatus Sumerlaeota bacterium]HMX63485.1 hypothetical protein [Candidatus Sumerlaeota bacterium]HNM46101.1 hypothetical protein [Candidatus Sumerlaeota bacterium]